MKKNSIKSIFAIACVAVASVSGIKAYNASNQSEVSMLLAENVEALSEGEPSIILGFCNRSEHERCLIDHFGNKNVYLVNYRSSF